MALRGKKPTTIEKRLKCLFYGVAGSGKTTAAISFPNAYLIDTERGAENAQYTDLLEKNGGAIFQSSDFNEVLRECRTLLTQKHEYKTLIIDPLTNVYNDLLESASMKVGTEFGRHYVEANKQIKKLLNILLKLDMNVIITSHSKNEYGDKMQVLGQTYDCYKKLDYIFDLVIEIKKQQQTKQRFGIVKKTRISTFNEDESFLFSYDEFAQRYGRDVIEKQQEIVELATSEQIDEIKKLIKILSISDEVVAKCLTKANADAIEDVDKIAMQKWIDSYRAKLEEV